MPETSKSQRINRNYVTPTELFVKYDNKFGISKYDFNLIVKIFFKTLAHSMMVEGKVFQIPKRLGTLGIRKRPTFGRGVFDYNLFKSEGLKVWKKNNHSSLYAAKIHWSTTFPNFFLGAKYPYHIYRFTPCRDYSRQLAKEIKQNNTISKYYDY